jgi:hypothetical protein
MGKNGQGAEGTSVGATIFAKADSLELWHAGECVARHERCYSRQQQILERERYLNVLERKPGALAGSTALAQWLQAGHWQELLQLGAAENWSRLHAAVEQALSLGCHDVAPIRHLMQSSHLDRPAVVPIDIGSLARY